jgi:AP-1-like factor
MFPGGYRPQRAATNGQNANHNNANGGTYNGINATGKAYTVSPTTTGRNGSQFSSPQTAVGATRNYAAPDRTNSASYQSQSADSPSTSSESHNGHQSSIGTSPEPMGNSPYIGYSNGPSPFKATEAPAHPPRHEFEREFFSKLEEACGCAENPVPPALARRSEQPPSPQSANQHTVNPTDNNNSNNQKNNGIDDFQNFDWLSQQNGGQFDPVLFADYREPQDAILSQDFGSFFDDAFPFASPDLSLSTTNAPKSDQVAGLPLSVDDDEVVPGEDRSKMLNCTRIWLVTSLFISALQKQTSRQQPTNFIYCYRDRLQSMEKFRSGELDIDTLCTELRDKARCSETGVVVEEKDVEEIMTRVH